MRQVKEWTGAIGYGFGLAQGLIILSVCLAIIGAAGCSLNEEIDFPGSSGGGGTLPPGNDPGPSGDDLPPPGPGPTAGTASGRLIVPPSNLVEAEPNETVAQAQAIASGGRISGVAAFGDAGFPLPGVTFCDEAEDLYRLSITGPVRITLTFSEDDPIFNDLDLLLLSSTGDALLGASEGIVAIEVVETSETGDFLIAVCAFGGTSAYVLSVDSLGTLASVPAGDAAPSAPFVPGDILVKWRPEKSGGKRQVARAAAAYGLTATTPLPPDVHLMHISPPQQALQQGLAGGKPLSAQYEGNALKALTLDTIRHLRQDPDVLYAEPNFLRQASRIPTDEFFNLQWHYNLIGLPGAWDITIGDDDVIVAVIDTGVLVNHPDLRARLIDGFDFISNAANANDGDGPDADPNDSGDDPRGRSSSFHGTHVAGTVGATSNNGSGVAGVTWSTRLMPLRVLGTMGGTDADIAQAIRYAAGLSNSSGTLPPEPANIINMSLGGPGLSQTLQAAVTAARDAGVIVVAAAGNENTSTFQFPASLDGVISVAAVDINANKTPYSNFGSGIDVAAPGGDFSTDVNGDGFRDEVLSTLGDDSGGFFFRFYSGTSMAAPHVAGVLALMLAVNPDLTPTDIDQLLAGTHPGTPLRITRDLGAAGRDDFFGHGLIDAAAAVIAAEETPGGTGATPTGSVLQVSTVTLNFDNFLETFSFELTNGGIGTLQVFSITENVPWLTLTPTSGPAPVIVTATVDRAGLSDGNFAATIQIASNATQGTSTASIAVSMRVGGPVLGDVGTVFVLALDENTLATVAQATTTFNQGYDFLTPAVTPGTYLLIAGTDRDDDGFICEAEDACGVFPEPVTISGGADTPEVDFVVSDLIAPQRAATQFGALPAGGFARLPSR